MSSSLALSQLGLPMVLELELLGGQLSLLLLLRLRRNRTVLEILTSAVPFSMLVLGLAWLTQALPVASPLRPTPVQRSAAADLAVLLRLLALMLLLMTTLTAAVAQSREAAGLWLLQRAAQLGHRRQIFWVSSNLAARSRTQRKPYLRPIAAQASVTRRMPWTSNR